MKQQLKPQHFAHANIESTFFHQYYSYILVLCQFQFQRKTNKLVFNGIYTYFQVDWRRLSIFMLKISFIFYGVVVAVVVPIAIFIFIYTVQQIHIIWKCCSFFMLFILLFDMVVFPIRLLISYLYALDHCV